jgi:L-arabinonolactonase
MMVSRDFSVFHVGEDQVGESPLWDASTATLWWVDAAGGRVHSKHAGTGEVSTYKLDVLPGALAVSNGAIIVAASHGWYSLDPESGNLSLLAGIQTPEPEMRFNDGVIDPLGRFWTGTMHIPVERKPIGALYRYDGSSAVQVIGSLRTQNGCAISPDGRTFYLSDSHPDICCIWAFDFDVETGALDRRRVFHVPTKGRPDGACVDIDGCYWFAAVDAGLIVRVDPDGREMETIQLPVSRPSKPAFGGPNMTTLFVTSMRAGLAPDELKQQPFAGSVFEIETGISGHEIPRFQPVRQPLRIQT